MARKKYRDARTGSTSRKPFTFPLVYESNWRGQARQCVYLPFFLSIAAFTTDQSTVIDIMMAID